LLYLKPKWSALKVPLCQTILELVEGISEAKILAKGFNS
jgi:hypothetical protein